MDTTSPTPAPTLVTQAPTEVQPPHLNTNAITQSPTTQLIITQEAHTDDTLTPKVQSLSNDVLQSTCTPTITQPPLTGTATAPVIDVTWTSLTDNSRILRVIDSPVSRNDDTHQPPHFHDISDTEETQLHRISKDLETIKSHLKTKDNEIELLNMEVKSAFTVIGLLQQRISELEQQNGNSRQCEVTTNVPTPSFCLLLGDTNFRRVAI
ncbi:hypothetical protein Pmani_002372 [Petrolisthes manimaculis]|uniref:Uncharacterized protein n=1 Tax=Petrolisthes manimaculis TaxID=1843537 RepID=A0AAE1QIP6_9EUCA|nr:hypothetical protein Pmani_002372 [Petrolisthes manimaculis]